METRAPVLPGPYDRYPIDAHRNQRVCVFARHDNRESELWQQVKARPPGDKSVNRTPVLQVGGTAPSTAPPSPGQP